MTDASSCPATRKEGTHKLTCQLPRSHGGEWHVSRSSGRRWPTDKARKDEQSQLIPPPSYYPAIITDQDELEETVATYLEGDSFVFDIETVGSRPSRDPKADTPALDEMTNKTIWIALARPGDVAIIPCGHPSLPDAPAPPQMSLGEVMEGLRPLFFSSLRKIGANVIFDALSLSKYWGAVPPGPYGDVQSLVHLLNENRMDYKLGSLSHDYLGFTYQKLGREGAMDTFPFWDVARYVGFDAKLTQLLWAMFMERMDDPALLRILTLESDVTEVLIHAKRRGVYIDRSQLGDLDVWLEGEIAQLQERIYATAGQEFLISSTQQKAKLLYSPKTEGGLGLTCVEHTKKGALSTAESALLPLAGKHPIVPMLLKHAEYSKLRGTYASGFAPHIHPDSRIRGRLNQRGTATGRMASSSPNLQNVPRAGGPDSVGTRIRSLFVAPPGYVLVVGDFSQIEYRVMGHFAGPYVRESRILKAYLEGIDLHVMTATFLYEKSEDEITKVDRQNGKTANFLLMFGGYPGRLVASGLARTKPQAQKIYDTFHNTYPEVHLFTTKTLEAIRRAPFPVATTAWGRRRRLPQLRLPSHDPAVRDLRNRAERQAINFIIQGCLPPDTKVLTRSGWIPIGEFENGAEVWTGNEWASAVRLARGPSKRLRLHLSDGRTFDCDDRHKLLVGDGAWPRWAGMHEIVGLPLVRDHDPQDWGRPLRDVEEWYWLGRMVGNGHLPATKQPWGLAFSTAGSKGPKDSDLFIEFLVRRSESFRGGSNSRTGFTVIRRPSGEVTQVVGGTENGRSYWEELGMVRGAKALQKRIPSVVFTLDRPRRQAFFDGYYAADGRHAGRGPRITSANRPLLEDTLRLMHTLGMSGRIGTSVRKSDGYEWFDVYIHTEPHLLTVEKVTEMAEEEMFTLSVDHPRHAFSSEGLISKNTAADLNKAAMVRAFRRIQRNGWGKRAFLVSTVHDEIIMEVPESLAEEGVALLTEAMEGVKAGLRVPLAAEVHFGKTWADAK